MAVAELFAGLLSVSGAETAAVLETVPALFGLTPKDTVADAALFRVPRLQVTVVVPLHEP